MAKGRKLTPGRVPSPIATAVPVAAFLDPKAAPLRDADEIRVAVELKLRTLRAEGRLDPERALETLTSVERVHWLISELLTALLDESFDAWLDRFARGAVDGPSAVARIAMSSRLLHPTFGRLLEWTARRAAMDRMGRRREPRFGVVPHVWAWCWREAPELLAHVVERWPETGDPFRPGTGASRMLANPRVSTPPRETRPHFPDAAVGFSPGSECAIRPQPRRDAILSAVTFALWEAGASDEILDVAFEDLRSVAPAALPEACSRWVSFDGDGGDKRRRQRLRAALDPLAGALGIPSSDEAHVVSLPFPREETLRALEELGATFWEPGRSAASHVVLVEAPDAEALEALLELAETGHLLAVLGHNKAANTLLTAARANGLVVIVGDGG